MNVGDEEQLSYSSPDQFILPCGGMRRSCLVLHMVSSSDKMTTVLSENCGFPAFTSCAVIFHGYVGGVRSFQPSLWETLDKWSLGKDSDRSWYHCHTPVKLS